MQNKYFKVLICTILIMILSMNPMAAFADDTALDCTVEPCINPLYEDIIIENDLLSQLELDAELYSDSYYFNSIKDVTEYMIDRIKDRDKTISFRSSVAFTQDQIMEGIKEHTGNPVEGDYIRWNYVTGALSRIKSNGIYYYTLNMSYYTTAAQEMELSVKLEKVMKELELDGLTDYQKVYSIYDYICRNVKYDEEHSYDNTYSLQYTTYAALVNGESAVQGYVTLFYRMCLMAGIDARCIFNTNYAWNIVCIDGKYYNVDAAWDARVWGAGRADYSYFLKCNANFSEKQHIRGEKYDTVEFNKAYPMSETDYPTGIDWELDGNGVLTITGPGIMPEQSPWAGNEDIKEVIIEKASAIKTGAFADCENITKVSADSTLKSIGGSAFSNCISLETVELNSPVEMGWQAFAGCTSLESFDFPAGTTSIAYKALDGCISIENITIPESVNNIDMYAFSNCRALESIIIPDGVEQLNAGVLRGCVSLKSVVLPNSILLISDIAFEQCEGLEHINIPSSVKSIGNWAFGNCIELKNITLPASVETIGQYAFYNCKNMEKIYIPKSVEEIGVDAFKLCNNLTIYGYEDSYAEIYALENDIPFVVIEGIPGDVNGDGNFDESDFTDVLNHIKGAADLASDQIKAADCYGNDGVVDIRDFCKLYNMMGK